MRHRLHSICPYFAMFPEAFARRHILAASDPGEVVFDPFCGRGTSIFEGLVLGRPSYGTDISPVAYCLANAKAEPPTLKVALERLDSLQAEFAASQTRTSAPDEFFALCFHPSTFAEICFLRDLLDWKDNPVDRFIAAVTLGCLHGESHKTPNCLSNRMPRTIATKKDYSVRWWRERSLTPPPRDTFSIVRRMTEFRLDCTVPSIRGRAALQDARNAAAAFPDLEGRVALVVTSPPYLDVTDYFEDQWLRWWFLGGPDTPSRGRSLDGDGRHRSSKLYWEFLEESWRGLAPLLRDKATIVVRIGCGKMDMAEVEGTLPDTLRRGLGSRVHQLAGGRESEIVGRQTNAFRPGTSGRRVEVDFRFAIS